EEALTARKIDYVVGRARYCDSARGKIIGDADGFLKLLFRWSDMTLRGVHVLGEQASEVVHVGLLAMLAKATADIFDAACFNVPTLGELHKSAAYDALHQASRRGAPRGRHVGIPEDTAVAGQVAL